MSPDPFRSLDRIDPPDRWDEIARRAESDDVVIALDDERATRGPRRRSAALVAAAAVVALVAGVAVAQGGDSADQDVAATDPSTPSGSGMGGPCPFTLDPELVPADLVPGTGDPASPYRLMTRSSVQTPERSPGSWGVLDYGGIPVTVAVHLADPDDPGGSEVRAELSPDDGTVVEVIAWGDIDGGTDACPIAEVRARLPLTDADRELREAEGDVLDLSAYLGDPVPSRILDAVRLDVDDAAPPMASDACASLMDLPQVAPTTGAFAGRTADGRTFTIEVDGDVMTIIDADSEGTGGRPDRPDQWVYSDSLLVGWLDPEAHRVGAVRPDGSVTAEGLVISPDGTLFALPDVGETADGTPWPIVQCDGEGRLLPETDEVVPTETSVPAGPPTSEIGDGASTTAPASTPDDGGYESTSVSWEGPVGDGRTYRVEIDGDDARAYVDGVLYGEAEDATPSWTDPMRAAGLWFSPDDGDVYEAVVIGAIPPGTVETMVLDAAGNVLPSPSLTISDDGRFYAIWAGDIPPAADGGEGPWVRNRAADGTLFPIEPDHDAARGIPGS